MFAFSARRLALSVCLLALLGVATCQSAAGPVVTSVSGCTDVGSMTVNCTLPVYLTVQGSGFSTGVSRGGPGYVNALSYWIAPQLQLSPQAVASGVVRPYLRASAEYPVNDTYFVFEIVYLGQGVFESGVPLTLTVVLGDGGPLAIASEPFLGVTVLGVPPPVIDTIAGCPVVGADGQSVAQCLPDRDVLTVKGSGFLQWQATPLVLSMGTVQTSLYLGLSGSYFAYSYIFNDTFLTLTLDNSYRFLLAAHDFGSPPLPFAIVERLSGWRSKSGMTIQFDALPPPSFSLLQPYVFVRLLTLPGCVWGPNQTNLVNCTAGYAGMRISGQYLYEVVATIGGQPMTTMLRAQQDAQLLSLVTPLYNFEPGVLYDFVLTAASGSITVPNYVSFTGLPAIVSAACRDPLLPIDIASLGCQPGETVTMNGPYLPPPTTAFTVTVYSLASKQNVSCANPRYNSVYQLACDMLVPGLPAPDAWDTWSANTASVLLLMLTCVTYDRRLPVDHTACVRSGICSGRMGSASPSPTATTHGTGPPHLASAASPRRAAAATWS